MASSSTPYMGMHSWVGADAVKRQEIIDNFITIDKGFSTVFRSKVYVELFKRENGELDDTPRLLRAIDAAPEGAELIFDPNVHYYWTSLTITKSLIINLNGANITLNPYATQTPAVWFKGSVGQRYLATADVVEKDRIIKVTGASTLFAKNDYVVVGDSHVTPPWTGSSTYTGRYELNMVSSVSGDNITLVRPLEWPYAVSDGSFVQKTNLINQPIIKNSGVINEVDPGVASTTSPASPGKGHIFQLQYCLQARVENCNVDGWQMHVVNTNFCILASIYNLNVRLPFRPTSGGHGYMVRDDNSLATIVEQCHALGHRHMVDWSRSYDGISRNNVAENQNGVSFYTHGTGCKRCKSEDDQVLGANSAEEGWAMGDPSFSADYDFQIINPKYIGTSIAIVMRVGSKGMRVLNPWILTRGDFAIGVSRGASGFAMVGGEINQYNSGTGRYAFLADITTGGSTPIQYPKDISIRGTTFKGNGKVYIQADGDIVVEDCDWDVSITPDSGDGYCLRVLDTYAPANLTIKGNEMKGSFERGIYGSIVPTNQYVIEKNHVEGYTTAGIQLRAGSGAGKLRFLDNTFTGDSTTANSFSSSLSDAITAGAAVRGNPGIKTKDSGKVTITSNGLNASYDIPHNLMMSPSGFPWGVHSGNSLVGDAGIRSISPFTNHFTVSFKTNPGVGDMIFHYWCSVEN